MEGKQKEDFEKLLPGAHFYKKDQEAAGAWYRLGKVAAEMHFAADDEAFIAALEAVTGTTEWEESDSPNFFLQMAGFPGKNTPDKR
jgi:hypothetical protein